MSYYKQKLQERFRYPNGPNYKQAFSGQQTLRRVQSPTTALNQTQSGRDATSQQAIVARLEQHIEYVERKLKASEEEAKQTECIFNRLKEELMQLQVENGSLSNRLAQEQRMTEELMRKYENEGP
jgi:septal ring factor EnvC (AmiA/AmiB activator)